MNCSGWGFSSSHPSYCGLPVLLPFLYIGCSNSSAIIWRDAK